MTETTARGFPSPFEVSIPASCDGWQEMYPYHALCSEDRREFEEGRFWFQVALHCPEPIYPFDALVLDGALVAVNQASARLFVVPPSLGLEYRIVNGYYYASANSVSDEGVLAERARRFMRRGGFYYEHWDELYARWLQKVEAAIRELKALSVPELPEYEDEAVVTEARGVGSSHVLLVAYDRLLEGLDRILQFHFEFLNLGYGAYLAFYELCRGAFPDIPEQTIASMVSGIDVLVLRPDDELRRLARRARELGVGDSVKGVAGEAELHARLRGGEAGERWLADFDATKDPWFHFSHGSGLFYHHCRSWIDDATLPIAAIGAYIERLEAGEDISRPSQSLLAERDRITAEHRALLREETRQAFDEQLGLSRSVFAYVEDHNFYIDHWYFTLFWNKVREFGALLARHRFLDEGEDVFHLRHDEVRSALAELRLHWSSGGVGAVRGPRHWPQIVARRKAIYAAMREWAPPTALGHVPAAITEPFLVMLFGITTERVAEWLSSSDMGSARSLTGIAGSPGIVEGRARVILYADQLSELEPGEILVAPSMSTSWTLAFGTIAAAVLDSGGIMSHAAIVAREYGLPAVVGTGRATKQIKTGDRIRVDANAGVVTMLE
jgi:pyruvate, water dikinase